MLGTLEWAAHAWLRGINLSRGAYARAYVHAQEALRLCQAQGRRLGEAHCLSNLADIARETRDLPTARAGYEQALYLAREVASSWGDTTIQVELGDVLRLQGDYGPAERMLTAALAASRVVGDHVHEVLALAFLGRVYTSLGDFARARDLLAQCMRALRDVAAPELELEAMLALATLALESGAYLRALEHAARAWQLAGAFGNPYNRGHAQTALAHAQAALRRPEAAATYQAAIAQYDALENPGLAAEPRAGLAALALAAGDMAQALAHAEVIVAVLHGAPRVGVNAPFTSYLACWRVLATLDDPRAPGVLASAERVLRSYAETITDRAQRRRFVEQVPAHRAIAEAASGGQLARSMAARQRICPGMEP